MGTFTVCIIQTSDPNGMDSAEGARQPEYAPLEFPHRKIKRANDEFCQAARNGRETTGRKMPKGALLCVECTMYWLMPLWQFIKSFTQIIGKCPSEDSFLPVGGTKWAIHW